MGSSLGSLKINGNSLPFLFEESRQLPIISLQLVFQVSGSLVEKEISGQNLSGIANLSASILNEGSSLSGSEKFSEILDANAISLSAGVGTETFVIRLDSLKENFPVGIKLLVELLENPNFKESVFKRVQKGIISSILQRKSNFDYVASTELKKMIFKGTPLENPKIGIVEDLEKINLNHIKKFIKNSLTLKNVIPIIGGDLSKSEADKILFEVLSSLKVGKSRELSQYSVLDKVQTKTFIKDTKQAYIYFASPLNIKYSDENLYKLKVASFILGSSGFGSRLMEEIRVKNGLAYSVFANTNVEKSRAYFSGYLQTKIENLEKAKDLVQFVISEFVENGVTKSELEASKSFILGSEPLRNETLSQRLGASFQAYYRGHQLDYRKTELQKIKDLTIIELNNFIKTHKEILELSFAIVTAK